MIKVNNTKKKSGPNRDANGRFVAKKSKKSLPIVDEEDQKVVEEVSPTESYSTPTDVQVTLQEIKEMNPCITEWKFFLKDMKLKYPPYNRENIPVIINLSTILNTRSSSLTYDPLSRLTWILTRSARLYHLLDKYSELYHQMTANPVKMLWSVILPTI